jgi:hypothetical protein
MTDEEMLKLARKLKLPPVMWNSIDFRTALIRVYVAGQAAMVAENDAVFSALPGHEELRRDQNLRAAGIKPRIKPRIKP